jgi:Domain of unknown function (DUF4145)
MTKTIKGHCPNCGPGRNAEIVANHEASAEADDESVWWKGTFQILQCEGCDEVYYRTVGVCSEDAEPDGRPIRRITYSPPPSKRKTPDWVIELLSVDSVLYDLVTETYVAVNNDAPVLAAVGLRTVFDRASEKMRVDPALGFGEKLDALELKGKIGRSEKETLETLTDAGGAAAHRGWKPTIDQINTLMDVGEQFLYRTIIVESQAKALRRKIPRRPKRKKKKSTP